MKPGAACKWYDESNAVENIIRPGRGLRKIIPQADDHPTPKPIALMEHFIRLHTQPGDVVLDTFAGHGTTLLAAQKLKRHFIGCDISAEYVEASRARLAKPYTADMFAQVQP